MGQAGDCGPEPGVDTVTAKWDNTIGNPAPSIFLEKTGPIENCAAAGIDIVTSLEGGPSAHSPSSTSSIQPVGIAEAALRASTSSAEIIDVDDLDQGVAFWSSALDAKEEPLSEESSQVYRKLRLPESDVRILLQRTADPKTHMERMHLDLESDDVEAEVRRLEALGATRYDHQQERGYDFWVLRDPWHNEFCVLQINFPDLLAQRPPWPDLGTAEIGS